MALLLRYPCPVSASVGPDVGRGVDQAADVVGRIDAVRRHQSGVVDGRAHTSGMRVTVGLKSNNFGESRLLVPVFNEPLSTKKLKGDHELALYLISPLCEIHSQLGYGATVIPRGITCQDASPDPRTSLLPRVFQIGSHEYAHVVSATSLSSCWRSVPLGQENPISALAWAIAASADVAGAMLSSHLTLASR